MCQFRTSHGIIAGALCVCCCVTGYDVGRLPDDDRDICFFDYYVDEAGEWDPWQSRVPDAVYNDHHNLVGEVFIDTVDTVTILLK